jgi:hypothetical protein
MYDGIGHQFPVAVELEFSYLAFTPAGRAYVAGRVEIFLACLTVCTNQIVPGYLFSPKSRY